MTIQQIAIAVLLVMIGYWGTLFGAWVYKNWLVRILEAVKGWQPWRQKKHRKLRPNSPRDCPLCATKEACGHEETARTGIWREQKARQGRKKRVSSQGYGCPNRECVYFGETDEHRHALVSDGWRGKRERIRQWRCQACGRRFSSRRQTAMYWLKTPSSRVSEILTALGEGVDPAASTRIFGHHERTILRWQRRGAQQAKHLHDRLFSRLNLKHVQMDELVVRVRSLAERVFVWTAMDSLTKLLVSFHVGQRRKVDAMQLVHDVWMRINPTVLPVFTSDGLNLYFYALTAHFGAWLVLVGKRLPVWQVAQSLLYGQLRKTRHQGQVRFNHTRMLVGKRADFRAALQRLGLTGTIQTAFVERLNLTLRESIATLSRRTWSIAYSLDSLRWSIEWGRAYYHFVRPHHSLTIRNDSARIVRRRTPAMAAGLAHKIWTVQDLLCLPLAP